MHTGQGSAIGHSSKRQQCIATSSTEAEIIAASTCTLEVMYFCALLRDLGLEQTAPTVLRVDNTGAIELSRDRKSCNKSRHIDRRYFKVREFTASGNVKVVHVPTQDNAADVLTKWLAPATFHQHVATLTLGSGSASVAEGGEGVHPSA